MKALLRKINKRIDDVDNVHYNHFLSTHEAAMINSAWLQIFGTGGCDCYPYTSELDMFNDLLEHYNLV